MKSILLQAASEGISEERLIIYLAGSVILFFIIRSFIRNPSQFLKAVAIRFGLFVFSIIYFFWDHDILPDTLGIAGFVDDIGIPIVVWKYYILKQFPFPRASNQNTVTDQKPKIDDGAEKNPTA